jgi:arylsulfatase A-like enzyme
LRLGYGDFSSYGNPIMDTPNIDALGQNGGIRFTDWISSAPTCTPSRAGIMTGRLAIRSGMSDDYFRTLYTLGQEGRLPASETTLGDLAKQRNYSTALFGKWHLGMNKHNSSDGLGLPTARGFDEWEG